MLVPDATVNYIKNPAIRDATTGWNASSSAISRSFDEARFDFTSLKIVTSNALIHEGAYYRVNTINTDHPCTVSAYLRGEGKVRIRLYLSPSGKEWSSKAVNLSSDHWTRLEITGRAYGDDVRLYVETDGDAPQSVTFYMDGAQMELKNYSTTYCDGEQPKCTWSGTFDSSTSSRPANTRLGGRWYQLTGLNRYDSDIYMTHVAGQGMASLTLNTQPYSMLAGSTFGNSKVNARVLNVTFFTKNEPSLGSQTTAALGELRQQLVDLLKPDRTYIDEPILLEWTDGDNLPLYLSVRYAGGLEGAWDIRNQWRNGFVVRFLAVDPFWYEDNQNIGTLGISQTVNAAGEYGFRKLDVDGSWDIITGFDANQYAINMIEGADGTLYFVDASSAIYSYDGETLTKIGTADDSVFCMMIGADGYMYIGGNFANVDAVPAAGIAYWDGAAWNQLAGNPLNTTVRALVLGDDGVIFAGGNGANGKAYYRDNGGGWHEMGAGGGSEIGGTIVQDMAISPDRRYVWVGGNFSVSTDVNITKYDIKNDTYLVGDSGDEPFDDVVRVVYITPDGTVYAAGEFQGNVAGDVTYAFIAKFEGGVWAPLGDSSDGMDAALGDYIQTIVQYRNGIITGTYYGVLGSVPPAHTISGLGTQYWNGSSWANIDIVPFGNATLNCYKLYVDSRKNLYVLGYDRANISEDATVENTGSAYVYPKVRIQGDSGFLFWLENGTQRVQVRLNYSLIGGEPIFIDFGQRLIYNKASGRLFSALRSGSEFSSMELMPGNNIINLFIDSDVNATAYMAYTPRHWSVDALARVSDI